MARRWHTGIRSALGVDFKGGTLVYVKFATTPNLDQIRAAMDKAGLHNARIQRYGQAGQQRGADRARSRRKPASRRSIRART